MHKPSLTCHNVDNSTYDDVQILNTQPNSNPISSWHVPFWCLFVARSLTIWTLWWENGVPWYIGSHIKPVSTSKMVRWRQSTCHWVMFKVGFYFQSPTTTKAIIKQVLIYICGTRVSCHKVHIPLKYTGAHLWRSMTQDPNVRQEFWT